MYRAFFLSLSVQSF